MPGRCCGAGLNAAIAGRGVPVAGGSAAAVVGSAWEARGVRRDARRCSTCCEAADCEAGIIFPIGSLAILKLGSTVRICKQSEPRTHT